MTNSPTDKLAVIQGIVFAWIFSAIFIGLGFWLSQTLDFFTNLTWQETLSLTLMPPSFSLAIGIGWAARTRHLKQNIDGSKPDNGTPLDITLRYIQNTSEQLLLFLVMAICLTGAAPNLARAILPVLGLWFFIARALFWIGYRRTPTRRAIGFAATFHPTLVFLLVSCLALLG